MKVTVIKAYIEGHPNEFASTTTHSREVRAKPVYWFKNEHSPIRLFRYLIKMTDVKTFVSVHLVRHSKFAEHAVMSKRDDLRPDKLEAIDRNTPVNHTIETNAQELINISKRRLCYKSHTETVAAWMHVCKAIKKVEPTLYPFLVPDCVFRNGICCEPTECKPGLVRVMEAYNKYPMLPHNRSNK